MKEIKAHDYPEIYEMLGYNLSKLGCLMLDTEEIQNTYTYFASDGTGLIVPYSPEYKAKNKDRFWIDGYVADKTPHITLFYGFLQESKCYKKHIEILLKDTNLNTVTIKEISYFDSPYPDEDYYCIVAKVEMTPELEYAHNKMKLLPTIHTFPLYKPHITIAYIIKDEYIRDDFIKHLSEKLVGQEIKVLGLNYGGNNK